MLNPSACLGPYQYIDVHLRISVTRLLYSLCVFATGAPQRSCPELMFPQVLRALLLAEGLSAISRDMTGTVALNRSTGPVRPVEISLPRSHNPALTTSSGIVMAAECWTESTNCSKRKMKSDVRLAVHIQPDGHVLLQQCKHPCCRCSPAGHSLAASCKLMPGRPELCCHSNATCRWSFLGQAQCLAGEYTEANTERMLARSGPKCYSEAREHALHSYCSHH